MHTRGKNHEFAYATGPSSFLVENKHLRIRYSKKSRVSSLKNNIEVSLDHGFSPINTRQLDIPPHQEGDHLSEEHAEQDVKYSKLLHTYSHASYAHLIEHFLNCFFRPPCLIRQGYHQAELVFSVLSHSSIDIYLLTAQIRVLL